MKPHRSYLGALDGCSDRNAIKGLAHITGGGLLENLRRDLPAARRLEVRAGSWPALPVFNLLAKVGAVSEPEMYRTFNMGIGMVIVASPESASRVREHLDTLGEPHYDIGRIIEGSKSVSLISAS